MNQLLNILIICIFCIYANNSLPNPSYISGGVRQQSSGGFQADNPWYRGAPPRGLEPETRGQFGGGGYNRRKAGLESAGAYPANTYSSADGFGYDYEIPGAKVHFRGFPSPNSGSRTRYNDGQSNQRTSYGGNSWNNRAW